MKTRSTAVLLALALAGCTGRQSSPDVYACRLISYTTAQLEACACTPEVEPDGVITVLAAPAGSYDPARSVQVILDGVVVERGTTGLRGELAMVVAIPGRDQGRLEHGIELTVEVDDSASRVFVRRSHESVLEIDGEELREIDADGMIEGSARFRPVRHDGVPRTDTSPIAHVFTANVDEPSASVHEPAPALGETFRASVRGIEHDLVLIGAIHADGELSGCWRPDYDSATCPPGVHCPGGWGELGVRRAGCSERRRRRGECRPDPIAEGTLDAGAGDAGAGDAGVDAVPPDAMPPDAMPPDAAPF